MAFAAEPHPAYFGPSGRDTGAPRRDTEVELHEGLAVAPLVAALHGVGARKAISPLRAALARLERERSGRADGIDLARLLLAWSTRWPDAVWDVTGEAAPHAALAPHAVPGERHGTRERGRRDDGSGRPALVGARVSRDVHELFEDRGARAGASAGEVLECVGRALLNGLTIAQLRDRLAVRD